MRLAVQVLGFEKQHRVVAADRGAQQAVGVQRRGRHHHAQSRQVGKDRFARLAVIDGASRQVSANGHADDHRAGEGVVRAPAQLGQFIANLHHGRPDVVEELNFHHRLQPARGHADGAAHDAGLRQRGVVAARAAKVPLQAVRDFEDSALAFHLGESLSWLQSATSSPKTTTRGSRAISSLKATLMRSTMVLGSPWNFGG